MAESVIHPYFISFPLDFILAKTNRAISIEEVEQVNFEITYIALLLKSGETIKIEWDWKLKNIIRK